MVSFIDEHREEHGVEPICRKLPIAPSTYYEQKAREADPSRLSARSVREVEFREEIERAWRGFLGRAGGHGVADSDDESVPKTGQNRRTSRPHLALRGTTWHKPPPTYTRVHARSKDLWDRHVVHPGPDVVTDAGLRVEEVCGSLDQVGVYVVVVPVDWESRRGLRHQRGSTVSDGSCQGTRRH